jgi:hypothetical protein
MSTSIRTVTIVLISSRSYREKDYAHFVILNSGILDRRFFLNYYRKIEKVARKGTSYTKNALSSSSLSQRGIVLQQAGSFAETLAKEPRLMAAMRPGSQFSSMPATHSEHQGSASLTTARSARSTHIDSEHSSLYTNVKESGPAFDWRPWLDAQAVTSRLTKVRI